MALFEQVAASFWDADNPTMRLPALSAEAVVAAQQTLGVVLPTDLLRLLYLQNGGVVADAWDACPIGAGDYVPFEHLAGIEFSAETGVITLLDTPYLVEEWGLPTPVVLLSGDGHTWVALDYRECGPPGEPSVCWLDMDQGQDRRLAPDFHAFVELLTASEDYPI